METQLISVLDNDRIQFILTRLKFLAKLQQGEKINVQELFVRNNDSILQRLIRTCKSWSNNITIGENSESKEMTLQFVKSILSETMSMITFYHNHNNLDIVKILTSDLMAAQIGIKNLFFTYHDERLFISSLQVQLDIISAQLKSLDKINDPVVEPYTRIIKKN